MIKQYVHFDIIQINNKNEGAIYLDKENTSERTLQGAKLLKHGQVWEAEHRTAHGRDDFLAESG